MRARVIPDSTPVDYLKPPPSSTSVPGSAARATAATASDGPTTETKDQPGKRTNSSEIRSSCDYCGKRKRKCDGDGVRSCSRCTSKNFLCVYSKKRPNWPRPSPSSRNMRKLQRASAAVRIGGHLKRCRLSASPATGLVGMEENILLNEYFNCLGFMPLTSQSTIREAMVRIMMVGDVTADRTAALCRITGVAERHSEPGGGGVRPRGAHGAVACSFWCAVAVGGLLQGRSTDSVARYVARAKAALHSCSDMKTLDVVRAWIEIALVHAFRGDRESFLTYTHGADALLLQSIADTSLDRIPTEMLDMLQSADSIRLHSGDFTDREIMDSIVRDSAGSLPQVGEMVTESDMSHFFVHALRLSGQAFTTDVIASTKLDASPQRRQDDRPIQIVHSQTLQLVNGGDNFVVGPQDADEESAGGGSMPQAMAEIVPIYLKLGQAVERPHIRRGIGGLFINTVLGFTSAGSMEVDTAVERLSSCVEVYENYPGLCRLGLGLHNAHLIISVLVSLRCTELYDKLRAAYNFVRPAGPPLPPLAEWKGMQGFCSNIYCLSIEQLVLQVVPPPLIASVLHHRFIDGESTPMGLCMEGDGKAKVPHPESCEALHNKAQAAGHRLPGGIGCSHLDTADDLADLLLAPGSPGHRRKDGADTSVL